MDMTPRLMWWFVLAYLSFAGQVGADADLSEEENVLKALLEGEFLQDTCSCTAASCVCCKTVTMHSMTKNVCGHITYGAQSHEFSIMLSADGMTLVDMKVTTSNPHGCKQVTVKGYSVRVCVDITNIKTESGVSGCLTVTVTMGQTYKLDLGCFKMQTSADKILLFNPFLGKILEGKK
ncbi:uncharacterized protein LOC125663018 [Ostrea edulis]|uniref:uncharacterized protein LOC125663018 n=1 Tax=Ostrea edulis TaxID=37623 RepID=UPI0024AEA0CD|nr:uncharacterized protein LOC125663018 [Ostrea edulis]